MIFWYNRNGGDKMSISKDNTRTLITLSKELKAELEQMAKDQNRSLNNLIVTILKEYIAKSRD